MGIPVRRVKIICFTICSFLVGIAGLLQTMRVEHADLVAAIDQEVASGRIVGGVLALSLDGRVICHHAVGLGDRETGRRVHHDARFRLASLTRAVTALTALSLVDRGHIQLHAPVCDYLPDFNPTMPDGSASALTIHHLLSHTAGLQYPADRHSPNGLTEDGLDIDAAVTAMAKVPLLHTPGTAWRYSIATDVLGAVIARVEGCTLGAAMNRAVLGPLGMDHTSFVPDDELSTAYADGDPAPVVMPSDHVIANSSGDLFPSSPGRALSTQSYQSGGGGLIGTARGYLVLLEAIRLRSPILSPKIWDLATWNAIGSLPRTPGDAGQRFSYLGGLMDDPRLAGSSLRQGAISWGDVYGNSWWVDFASGVSAVLLTNTATEALEVQTATDVRAAVYSAIEAR